MKELGEGQILDATPPKSCEVRPNDMLRGYRVVSMAAAEARIQAPYRELKLPPEHWNIKTDT